jgi:hypothetical protein
MVRLWEASFRRAILVLILGVLVGAGCGGGGDGGSQTSVAGGGDGGNVTRPTERTRKWFLPPAGPGTPAANEDSLYHSLHNGECQLALEAASDSGTFFFFERYRFLFQAGAHACLGQLEAAEQAFDRAERLEWGSVGPEVAQRVCALDKAVVSYLLWPARPCGVQIIGSETTSSTTAEPSTSGSATSSTVP